MKTQSTDTSARARSMNEKKFEWLHLPNTTSVAILDRMWQFVICPVVPASPENWENRAFAVISLVAVLPNAHDHHRPNVFGGHRPVRLSACESFDGENDNNRQISVTRGDEMKGEKRAR